MGHHGGSDGLREADGPPDTEPRRLIESASSHAIFELGADGTIRSWPTPAATLYGYDAEAVLGSPVSVLFADEREGPDGSIPDPTASDPAEVECWHERADGSVFWGTMALSSLGHGPTAGYVAICHDSTTEKEYERMLERQNDRLKEFTDILAHDLRNPLAVIDGNLALYEESGDESHIQRIDETTDRMARLVDDLLRVARQGDVVTDPEPTDVEAVVETAWRAIASEHDATLLIEPVPAVSGDPDRLCQLFENLFVNAVEHGGEGVTVRVGPLETGFCVEDDGPGIEEELRDEVFDHGFTTAADGSGYGLSVVRTIVNAHGWDVAVKAGIDGGARFEITGIEFLE